MNQNDNSLTSISPGSWAAALAAALLLLPATRVRGQEPLVLDGHTESVTSAVFSPDGKRIVSGSRDNTVKVWNAESGKEIFALEGHTHWVLRVAISLDGKRLASASRDGTVKVWDADKGKELFTLKGHTNWVNGVAFSPDSKRLATGSSDGTVKIWDADTGNEILTIGTKAIGVTSVAFSPDGKRVASAGGTVVKVWDLDAGKLTTREKANIVFKKFGDDITPQKLTEEINKIEKAPALVAKEAFTLIGHFNFVQCVAFSPDGQYLASGSADATARVWDAANGRSRFTLEGHGSSAVIEVAFSPDGKRLATGCAGFPTQVVNIWDAATGRKTLTLDSVALGMGVGFSPDWMRRAGRWGKLVKVSDATVGQK